MIFQLIVSLCETQVLDPPDILEQKTSELAQAMLKAKCLVVYTGAGVSTVRWPEYLFGKKIRLNVINDLASKNNSLFFFNRRPRFLITGLSLRF